ncbi:hypothetical protein H4696_005353 [Amycolatopsis lexingtonensis]|uniref:DUF4145 domain-containing protein n=1 Tax=Amycolatopsis lexingtonensis TaxID=218822 RepID=A0ABR9I4V5_9PSEU|nr:hypothetical protein [Amycolatopsis lexingtonensis]MBE1498253.1 hypothetical protein [Amycolatopsis lexingtonensis]
MEWFKVSLDFVSSLAWPLTLIVFLIIFRSSIGTLLTRLTRAEVAGQKFDFGSELKAAESSTEAAIDAAQRAGEPPSSDDAEVSEEDIDEEYQPPSRSEKVKSLIVGSQPTGLVMQSWLTIESAIGDLHEKLFGAHRGTKLTTVQRQIDELVPYLPADAVDSIRRMRKMRNEVAHGNAQVDLGEAIAYAETAAAVVDLIGYLDRATPSR